MVANLRNYLTNCLRIHRDDVRLVHTHIEQGPCPGTGPFLGLWLALHQLLGQGILGGNQSRLHVLLATFLCRSVNSDRPESLRTSVASWSFGCVMCVGDSFGSPKIFRPRRAAWKLLSGYEVSPSRPSPWALLSPWREVNRSEAFTCHKVF